MYEKTSTCEPVSVTVVVQNPISVKVTEPVVLPVVKVLVPGIQGPASVDRPLDTDPLETYLQARGNFPNGNNSEQSN
nr:MAG TPA: hypothetical protein [Caudoviricetes sp.]